MPMWYIKIPVRFHEKRSKTITLTSTMGYCFFLWGMDYFDGVYATSGHHPSLSSLLLTQYLQPFIR